MQPCPRLTRDSGLKRTSSSYLRERDEFIRCEYNNNQYDPYIQPHHCLKLQHYQKTTRYLYLSPCSFLPCGSRLFLIPSRVLETASLAPIIGFNTAIGTALTTALNGPYSSALHIVCYTMALTHIITRPLVHFHRYRQYSLSCGVDIPR